MFWLVNKIEAMSYKQSVAFLSDGQIIKITNWFNNGEESDPTEATHCACGPCKDGFWYVLDLTKTQTVEAN